MLRITSFPSLMLAKFAFGNFYEVSTVKMMLSTKLLNTMNSLLNAIGRNHYESTHPMRIRSAQFSPLFKAHGRSAIRKASFPNGFLTLFKTEMRLPHLFAGFKRSFRSHARPCNTVNIEVGSQFVQPVLFSRCQGHGQNILQHLKGKSVFTVLIPGTLQDDVIVSVAPKHTGMRVEPLKQIHSTANIKLASGNTHNAINTRCNGDITRGHTSNCLSLVALLSCCQGARLHLFAQGNYSHARQHPNYTFFLPALKAEV